MTRMGGPGFKAKPSLLIVDDYAPTRLSFAAEADEMGCFAAVHTLASGDDARSFLEQCASRGGHDLPDVVLTDLYMECGNGIELLEYLRRQPAMAGIVGALMSANFDHWEKEVARKSHCRVFYRKPSSAAELRFLLGSVAALATRAMADPATPPFSRAPFRIKRAACNSAMSVCSEAEVVGWV